MRFKINTDNSTKYVSQWCNQLHTMDHDNVSPKKELKINGEYRRVTCQVHTYLRSDPEVIQLFLCINQLSTNSILLINVKMPTTVGILTFISMINTTFSRLKANKSLFVGILVFKKVEISCSVESSIKKFYNLGARSGTTCI